MKTKPPAVSNQSVSLDDVRASDADESVAVEPHEASSAAGDEAGGRYDEQGRRLVKRREPPSANEVESKLFDDPAPWYQSSFVPLVIVLALIGGLYYALKKWSPRGQAADSDLLSVVARTTLTPRQHLALVHLGQRFVLIAVSPERVDVLSDIADQDEVADLVARTRVRATSTTSQFDSLLRRESRSYQEPLEESIEGSTESIPTTRETNGKAGAAAQLSDLLGKLKRMQGQKR